MRLERYSGGLVITHCGNKWKHTEGTGRCKTKDKGYPYTSTIVKVRGEEVRDREVGRQVQGGDQGSEGRYYDQGTEEGRKGGGGEV